MYKLYTVLQRNNIKNVNPGIFLIILTEINLYCVF